MSHSKSKKVFQKVLKLGDKGKTVSRLQNYLTQFGYTKYNSEHLHFMSESSHAGVLPKPGHFDEETEKALFAFQKRNGLLETGLLDEATIGLMNTPRCGFPDVGEYAVEGRKWTKNDLTYGFENFTGHLSAGDIRSALAEAFGLWGSVTKLTFAEIPLANSPDIKIKFVIGDHGDGSSFDGPAGVLAHAFYPPPNGGDLAGDVHFDGAEKWSVALPVPASSFDLVSVAAHEIGHALGLAHSNIQPALMYAYYSGVHRFLHSDDIAGIQSIYQRP